MSAELRALIREVAAEHPRATPGEIAQYVAKLAAEGDLRAFLEEALYPVVSEILGGDRRSSMDGALGGKGGGNRSPKLEQRRAHFAKLMAERVHVAGTGWKTVGECTVEDLRACIQERITLIQRTQGQVANFEQLVDMMKKHKAKVAADLVGVL